MSNTQNNDGGQAFPCQPLDAQGKPMGPLECGMSLRDWFAGQALQGWIASQPKIDGCCLRGNEEHAEQIADTAYQYADAMLKAREQSQKEVKP